MAFIIDNRGFSNSFPNLDGCVGALCGLLGLRRKQLKALMEEPELRVQEGEAVYELKYFKKAFFSVQRVGEKYFASFTDAALYDNSLLTVEEYHHKNYCVEKVV